MKKFKYLLMSLLLVSSMAAFTACGMKAPTEDDVKEAIEDEGLVPDADDEDSSDYTINVGSIKMNDDKDKATAKAEIVVTEGSFEKTTSYKITFKVKDKEWKAKDFEKEETKSVLVAGPTEDRVNELMENVNFEIMDEWVYLSDEYIDSIDLGDVEFDADSMTAKMPVEVKATYGKKIYSFKTDVNFDIYEGSEDWNLTTSYIEINDYDSEYSDDYKFELSDDQAIADLSAMTTSVYAFGTNYSLTDMDTTIGNMSFEVPELDGGNYAYIPATFTLKYKSAEINFSTEMVYYFDGSEWAPSYLNSTKAVGANIPVVGKWKGANKDKTESYVIEISNESNDNGYLAGKCTMVKDKLTFVYNVYVSSYDPGNDEATIYFDSWVTLPTGASTWDYKSFSVKVVDDLMTPQSSWEDYSLSRVKETE